MACRSKSPSIVKNELCELKLILRGDLIMFYTAKDIRRIFNITQRQIEYLFESGKLKPVKMLSNSYIIFTDSDIERIKMILKSRTG